MESLVIQLILLLIFAAISAAVAASKGRTVIGWFFLGLFLGLIGVIIIAVLPNLKKRQAQHDALARENRRLQEHLKQAQVKQEAFQRHASTRLDSHDGHLGLDTRQIGPPLMEGDTEPLALSGDPGPPSHVPQLPLTPQWYYAVDGSTQGPIPEDTLVHMFRLRELDGSTLVWTESFNEWTPASKVPTLQRFLAS